MSVLTALHLSRIPALGFVAVGVWWGTFAAHVPVLKAQIGADVATFGLLLLGTGIGLVSAMLAAPRLDSRLGARGMQAGALALALACLVPAWTTTPVTFFAAMVCLGFGSGLCDILMNARVSDLEARHRRTLMNANHAVFSVAYATAALVSAATRGAGVPVAVAFAGAAAVILALAAGMRMAPAETHDDDPAPAGARLPWVVWLCGFLVLLAFMTEASVEAWSAVHIEETLGGAAAQGALGPAMLGITMAVGRFAGQALTERFRELAVVTVAAAICATGALLAALAPGPALAYAGFAVLGLGVSVIGPIGIALAGRMVGPSRRTAAISRAAILGFSGFFIAPALMGLIGGLFGLRAAFGAIAVIVLLVWPLAGRLARYELADTIQARP